MKILGLTATLFLAAATVANYAQQPELPHEVPPPIPRSQVEAMLKADHQRAIQDAAQLIELAESLKQELEKDDRHVLSVNSLRKTEEIEKLARKIRGRLKRF
jgi:hypothetical protein